MNNKSARNSFILAAVIFVITASFFAIVYVRTKRSIENFNVTLGKDEKADFAQVMQVIGNNSKLGTIGENVQYEKAKSNKGVVEIKEKMFITQVNDVYLNAEDYLGKTIKLEGIFKQEEDYYFVIRYGPGCCGNDANAGFEVAWAKGKTKQYPDVDSWVEATGVLKTYGDEGFMQLLYLDLTSLTKLSKRGAETVMQ